MSFPVVINADHGSLLHNTETTGKEKAFGQRAVYADGRRYAYAKAGAALIIGDLCQGVALVAATDTDLVIGAVEPIGETAIDITTASSDVAGFFDGGWVHINKAAGATSLGLYRAAASGANILWTSGANDIINLDPADPLRVALAVSDELGVNRNEFDGVVVAPTTPTNRHVGVAVNAIASGSFGFVQTYGVAAVNVAASTTASARVLGLTAVEGQVAPEAETAGIGSYIGDVMVVGTTAAELGLVFLRID